MPIAGVGSAAQVDPVASLVTALNAATTALTASTASSLQKSSNLSDLASASSGRTNLGLGSAATMTPATIAADSTLNGYYARTTGSVPPPIPPAMTVISTFQSGHGWTSANAGAATNLNNTSSPVIGSQYATIQTTGAGSGTPARLTKTGLSVNMTGRKFALLMRVTNTANLDNVFLYAGSSGFAAYDNFQLDRYEDSRVLSWWREGEWAWMVFGWETLNATVGTPPRSAEVDLRIAIVDKAGGGSATVTADIAALASVAEPTQAASGIVSFTFDDNWRSQYTLAKPILDGYLYPGTAYVIADVVGTSTQGREGSMSLAELQQLQNVNRWEVAAHSSTLAHHDATGGFGALSATELDAENLAMKSWLKVNGFRGYEHLAYPQGIYNATVLDRTKAWYTSGRALNGFANDTWPPNDVYRMRTCALNSGITLAAAKVRVDKAKAGKGWLIFLVHRLDTVADSLTWVTSDFQSLVDYVNAQGLDVKTVGQTLATR